MATSEFARFVVDILSEVRPVRVRAMFGGYGVYADKIMFGLIADDVLYFKVGPGNEADYVAEGLEPFVYDGKDKPVAMSYRVVPERLFDDAGDMAVWMGKALDAAMAAKGGAKKIAGR